ncbi:carboxypeptidase-like regulatory domain-containing protein [Tamlana sp. I1]|uniref:carboxypeptidase-like regulatory domain-containing protein n=1 Tax=Tamlana sp. I1 TaxID=2762061 RepID=UPI00188F56EF|nr:carboxypeptidase-like regulatory domain-containing protein [Tamlana sp. I1]
MKVFLLTTTLFFSLIVYSQEKILSGRILNFENKAPLAYVNIGIKNKTVGTVSNKNGLFNLALNNKVTPKDTVVFSHVGFKTEKYIVSDLDKMSTSILLQSKNIELAEIIVNSNKVKLKAKKIGRSSKGLGLLHSNFYSYYEKDVDDRLSKERGMKFKIRRNCNIKDLNFNISSNDFKSLKFRVNFYNIKDGVPSDLIVQENIVFEIKDNFLGWFTVDLEPYEIYLNEETEDVAVTIQWIESVKDTENSKFFSISTASSPTHTAYYREKAMDNWNKSGQNLSFYLNAMCE